MTTFAMMTMILLIGQNKSNTVVGIDTYKKNIYERSTFNFRPVDKLWIRFRM